MNGFSGNVVFVTGASGGLGSRMVRRLLQSGANVGAIDFNSEALENLKRECNSKLATAVADVTDRDSVLAAVTKLEGEIGPCDRLVANAGIGIGTPALRFHSPDFAKVISVNLIGVANSVEAVLPGMIARRRGHIVGISSLASFRGLPALSAYCAAKAGVNALFDSLRVELKRHGVRTTTICPGWIRTPLTAPWEGKIGNMMEPDDAVEKILRAIEQQRAFVAFPPRLAWLLHLVKCLPVSVGDWLLQREIRKIESMMQST